ncbi:phytase [Mycobacterium marinum]|uniref:esterase-like activity of phytase family protein n=1 Tax=Mycobacterium marinum TaxID=1781 RepID=UPI0021C26E79|nr:esterase-like activity of phytase family protein [Mycobacterium marinum]GJP27856.1 phytase [Mycobacterium marinum]
MKPFLGRLLACLLVGCVLCPAVFGCAPTHQRGGVRTPAALLSYLGQAQIPFGASVDGAVIGGLSGISYDADRQVYYVISDDRSDRGPGRFFTMRLALSDIGISDITVTGAYSLLDRDGKPFGPLDRSSTPPVISPDPEGIAVDTARRRLYWSSEGERLTDRQSGLLDPWIRIADLDGRYLGQFTLPPNLAVSAQRTGPRNNQALEGLALTPDGRSLYAAMEEPGLQDEPPANTGRQVLTRFTKFDVETAAPTAQYAYPMEPAASPAVRNGVSDLVALSDTTFLVVERTATVPPVIRIFRAEIGAATDVLSMPTIHGTPLTPMRKTLAADLPALAGTAAAAALSPLNNIEGITLGPKLADGRQSVVLVSDNDFSPAKVTQLLLWAMP